VKKKIVVVVLFVAVTAGSYGAGYLHAERKLEAMTLAQALGETTLCANGLNTLGQQRQEVTVRLLDQRLRGAVELAESHSHAIGRFEFPVPNLISGVQRARAYADRIGDAELSRRLGALHQKLTARG
jgi:L-ribulose-5-phosphate 3-epimerase UlaE